MSCSSRPRSRDSCRKIAIMEAPVQTLPPLCFAERLLHSIVCQSLPLMRRRCHEAMAATSGAIYVLLLSSVVAGGHASNTFPAFVWGSGAYVDLPVASAKLRASYADLSASYLVDSVFGSFCCTQQQDAAVAELNSLAINADWQELVSIFVVGKLAASELADGAAHPALRNAVEAAPAALYLPNIKEGGSDLAAAVRARSQPLLQIGDCGTDSVTTEQLATVLAEQKGHLSILACEGQSPTLLQDMHQLLDKASRPFVFVYAGQPEKAAVRPPARSLVSTSTGASQNEYLCTGKCMVQVRLFECIILIIVLLSALGAGLCMLHNLDAPSKFESEKKDTSRHQD